MSTPTAPTTQQYKDLLQKYQQQNAQCRNRLYEDFMKKHPHLHPVKLIVMGVILGVILATAAFLLLQ